MHTHTTVKTKDFVDTKCIISSMLNDTEKIVAHCMIMRLGEKEALSYLKTNGHGMSRITYYRIRRRLKSQNLNRLQEIITANNEFVTDQQHLQMIDQLELIAEEMWKLYHLEVEPYKKAKVLEKIANIQPYLSSYYEALTMTMEQLLYTKNNNGKTHIF